MKFTSFFSAALVFALSAVNAKQEPAVLHLLPTSHEFPQEYVVRINLLSSETSREIILRTKEPNWITPGPVGSHGIVNYNQLPNGPFGAVINDNYANGGRKAFRIDLTRPGEEFHYEGTSVTDEFIENLPADGYVRAIENVFRHGNSRYYRNQDSYFYKD
ncbi:hypothetical protein K492DRAFT_197143 [Lichtheimia hyalospora FSU 10163]|nr:hypothetical protein K492DRAFT_197143 [Lichtheimia hyalospora FSU 10163]